MLGQSAEVFFMLGRLAAPKTLQTLGRILTYIIWRDALDHHPSSLADFFVQNLLMAHFGSEYNSHSCSPINLSGSVIFHYRIGFEFKFKII